MMTMTTISTVPTSPTDLNRLQWLMAYGRDYYELCKPRVVALMLLTAYVGMHLAIPHRVPWSTLIFGGWGIALAAAAAAVINHRVDRFLDQKMQRTKHRPVASGRVSPKQALLFAMIMAVSGFIILFYFVNHLTAYLTMATLLGYAVVYTMFLKHATPQNIVIGGLAGAAPPLLGWTAVSGQVDANALLLVLIIYTWTPPHFWALAIHRYDDYKTANVPMLPVTHGKSFTQLSIVLYSILMVVCSILPFFTRMSGYSYLLGALGLGGWFMYRAVALYRSEANRNAIKLFHCSIIYLMVLFVFLLIDHYR